MAVMPILASEVQWFNTHWVTFCYWIFFCFHIVNANIAIITNFVNLQKNTITDFELLQMAFEI